MALSSNLKARLPGIINAILHEKSGGCKFTEFIVELQSWGYLNETDRKELLNAVYLEELEKLLMTEPAFTHYFGLLEYSWDMSGNGQGPVRTKAFVYSKGNWVS